MYIYIYIDIYVLIDVAKGLLYLHGRGLVHFDIKVCMYV